MRDGTVACPRVERTRPVEAGVVSEGSFTRGGESAPVNGPRRISKLLRAGGFQTTRGIVEVKAV